MKDKEPITEKITLKDLEPRIKRYRLIIEGKYTIKITEKIISQYLLELAKKLHMEPLIKPIIFSPNAHMHPIHHGIAGFIGWVASGGSVYTWDRFKFVSIEIYTCDKFLISDAVKFTKKFFKTTKIFYKEIKV